MLRNATTIRGYKVLATEGEIGKVDDLLFDDQSWTIRYLALDAGSWMEERQVLVAPTRVESLDDDRELVLTDLARTEVETCPPADCEKPLSARADIVRPSSDEFWPPSFKPGEGAGLDEVHLRSMNELTTYRIAATDGDVGRVAGLVVDDRDWVIRYLVVDTHVLWPGKHVILSTEWVESAEWHTQRVRVNVPKTAIKDAPEYDPNALVSREYETALCRFYDRKGYWDRECGD